MSVWVRCIPPEPDRGGGVGGRGVAWLSSIWDPFQAFLNCTARKWAPSGRQNNPVLESAHELVCTKERAVALLSGSRPRHSSHVAGPVGDPGDSGGPWPADWLCRG